MNKNLRKNEMPRLNTHSITLLLAAVVFCVTGCRPRGILHSREMRDVLVDLHKTDALLQISGAGRADKEVKAIYYAQVLEKHGVTQARFDSSLVWYTAHPQLFDKIYPKVIAQLQAEQEQFIAEHENEFSTIADFSIPTAQSSITKSQMDSVLWVMRSGYASAWNPLVHDFENQLFPKVSILR